MSEREVALRRAAESCPPYVDGAGRVHPVDVEASVRTGWLTYGPPNGGVAAMRDGRCETCKWWETWRGQDPSAWSSCRLTAIVEDKALFAETKAKVSNLPNTYGVLKTAPDFGCVQWEAKE